MGACADLSHHAKKEIVALQLVLHQRVSLCIASQANRLLQKAHGLHAAGSSF